MQNCLIGFPNRVDTSTLSGGSWVPSLPLDNLKRRELSQVARSSGLTLAATQLTLDLGSSRATRVFAAVNHNLTTTAKYRLRGSSAQTQNLVENSMMAGAVAGSPGTLPTGWANIALAAGLARTLSVGTEDGMSYLDVRVTGTPSASGGIAIYFTAFNAVPGVVGSSHSIGANMRLMAGTTPSSVYLGMDEVNSSGTGIGGYNFPTTPSNKALRTQRYTYSRILQAAGSVYARPYIYLDAPAGVAVDFTLRIAALMFNAGLQPFDHIPTSGGAVTAPAFNEHAATEDLSVNKRFFFPEAIAGWSVVNAFKSANTNSITLATVDTNLLAYPRYLDNPLWVHAGVRNAQQYVQPNVAANPFDGKFTVDRLIETGQANSDHYIYQSRTATNEILTFSTIVKAAGRTRFLMQISNFVSASANATFNLQAGTVAFNSGGADYTDVTASIAPYGSGYYVCTLTARKGSFNNINSAVIWLVNDVGQTNYTGDGFSGIDIAHTQLELWTVRTPPIADATAFAGRAGIKWDWDATGTLVQTPANVAVEAYDPTTLVSRGLSLEPAGTNLLLYSTDMVNPFWVKVGATVSTSVVAAPDNTTMFKLVESTGNTGHYVEQYPTIVAGNTYTRSIFLAAGERKLIRLEYYSNPTTSVSATVFFNAGTGVFSGPSSSAGVLQTYGAQQCPNGVWRVWQTVKLTGTDTQVLCRVCLSNDSAITVYTGDGVSGAYLWGEQMEIGPVATSYMPSAGAAGTRAADTSTANLGQRLADTTVAVHNADPTLSTDNVFIDGSKGYIMTARVRRVAGTGWDGAIYFRTPAHSYTESTKAQMIQPIWGSDGWGTITTDMRTTASGTQSDFHTAAAVTAVRFDFGNRNTDIFEIESIAFGTAPASFNSTWKDVWPAVFEYGTLEWEDDGWWSGRYTEEELEGYTRTLPIILPEAKAYRYWTLELNDTSNPAGYVQLGRVFLGPAWQPSKNASYGLAKQFETTTSVQRSLSGVARFQPQKPMRVTKFTIENITENEGLSRAFDLDRQAGIDKEVFWVENPDDVAHAVRRQYLGRFRALGPLETPYYNLAKKTYEIEEQL